MGVIDRIIVDNFKSLRHVDLSLGRMKSRAAFLDDLRGTWEDARNHPRMKEDVFEPLLAQHGDPRRASGGRDLMIGRSLQNLQMLFRLCPETERLRDRIAAYLHDQQDQ